MLFPNDTPHWGHQNKYQLPLEKHDFKCNKKILQQWLLTILRWKSKIPVKTDQLEQINNSLQKLIEVQPPLTLA